MSLQDGDTTWFLAQLKPNCAQIADRNLRRQGFKTFLPMQEETRRGRDRFITRVHPLFPGYIFVAFDVARGLWRAINSTQGVCKLVSFGAGPAPVPGALVDELMQRSDGTSGIVPLTPLQAGDQVRVTTGPFADFAAEIENITPERRVWILLDILGRQSRVSVDSAHLRAV